MTLTLNIINLRLVLSQKNNLKLDKLQENSIEFLSTMYLPYILSQIVYAITTVSLF